MITGESELVPFEEHMLAGSQCAERAEEAQGYVDAIRVGLIKGGFDLGWPSLKKRGEDAAHCGAGSDSRSRSG